MSRQFTVFAWDPAKADANERKHGVGFDEATSVFLDDHALLIPDPDYAHDEERFLLLGSSARFRLLVVCHCYRENEHVIRLISARKATRHEAAQYLQQEAGNQQVRSQESPGEETPAEGS